MTLPENCCGDPLEGPCGWGTSDFPLVYFVPQTPLKCLPGGTLVSLPQEFAQLDLPQGLHREVRCQDPEPFQPPSLTPPWGLFLEYLGCLQNHDLGVLEQVLENAARAGCAWVVAPGVEADDAYRYRLYSLLRLLCDQRQLKFSIFEEQAREKSSLLNHYLANARGCCRFPGYSGRRQTSVPSS